MFLVAHLVNTGFGPFYDGITHLGMTPEDILPVLAFAALAGLGGAACGRVVLGVLPAAWLLGGVLGLQQEAELAMPVATTLSFLIPGALVAADLAIGRLVIGCLAAGMGLFHGFLNGTAMASGGGVMGLLGIAVAVFVAVTLLSAFVVSLQSAWARIVVRVSGSWIAAIGLLMLGWSLR